MFYIFLLLIIGFFFPLLLIPFLIFGFLLLLFIPFKFTFDSIFSLFAVPKQIYQIATNSDLRRNHALEHATVNTLEKEYGYRGLAGYAGDDGFYIIGVDNIYEVEEAARKGISLLKDGHHNLAIHSRCGTSLTVANFLSAIIFLVLLISTGYFSIINMIIAIIIANLIGPYLGRVVQKNLTTTSQVKEMEIVSACYESKNSWNQPVKIFVKTQRIPYINS